MSVKIFLPKKFFYIKHDCDIFGEIQINENAISYFVIDPNPNCEESLLRHLGHIAVKGSSLGEKDVSLSFIYNFVSPTVYLNALSIKPPNVAFANVFLYNTEKIQMLHFSQDNTSNKDLNDLERYSDIRMLYTLLSQTKRSTEISKHTRTFISQSFNFILDSLTAFFSLIKLRPFKYLFEQTSSHEHYMEWQKFRGTG